MNSPRMTANIKIKKNPLWLNSYQASDRTFYYDDCYSDATATYMNSSFHNHQVDKKFLTTDKFRMNHDKETIQQNQKQLLKSQPETWLDQSTIQIEEESHLAARLSQQEQDYESYLQMGPMKQVPVPATSKQVKKINRKKDNDKSAKQPKMSIKVKQTIDKDSKNATHRSLMLQSELKLMNKAIFPDLSQSPTPSHFKKRYERLIREQLEFSSYKDFELQEKAKLDKLNNSKQAVQQK